MRGQDFFLCSQFLKSVLKSTAITLPSVISAFSAALIYGLARTLLRTLTILREEPIFSFILLKGRGFENSFGIGPRMFASK